MNEVSEKKKKQFRTIYDALYTNPQVPVKDISSLLHINWDAASARFKEAFEYGYILCPQMRKRSYANTKEYVYIANCEEPFQFFEEYIEDPRVIRFSELIGDANLWIISREKIDIEGDILIEGYHSDYHVAYAPNHSWDTALDIMRRKVETFDPHTYEPKRIIETHWDESIEWDDTFEILYREFKFNIRKKKAPLKRKYNISERKLREWYEKFPEYCTVFTRYFPDRITIHRSYLFIFETDYQDFVIDLFSQFPSSSWFFTVSHSLFVRVDIPAYLMLAVDRHKPPRLLDIYSSMRNLLERGITKNQVHSVVGHSWSKRL